MAERRKSSGRSRSHEVRATGAFACHVDGEDRFVHEGETFESTDKLVMAHRDLFEPSQRTSSSK
jgi:hypothetical protein